jgi:myo-inositol-1(or 4)-monophosphatase
MVDAPFSPRAETVSAIAAARAAGEIARARTNADLIQQKGILDIATGTDLACEDAIRARLLADHPGHTIVGEERGGQAPEAGGTYWLLDPICGTQSFASKLSVFCTNIALVEDGVVTAAAVSDGVTGDVYWAERGRGAYVERGVSSERLRARDGHVLGFELAGSPIYTGAPGALGALFGAVVAAGRWHPRLLGTTLPFARVANGDFAGLFQLGRCTAPLHTAAGCLLADEAGARVTDPFGQPWDLGTTEFVVAATAELHRDLLALYAASFGARFV